ncbi:hypothetical protein QJS10_CPA16g01680 [Acorus calamus]|uniref:Uncharacterized protein n=1 Tax=Acorus calamus TaxID=4465 RepID=A0AAV9D2U9_ACOCL|nr:hypothetical protein QJS10_CPA16g01680 [Acorus calamus]
MRLTPQFTISATSVMIMSLKNVQTQPTLLGLKVEASITTTYMPPHAITMPQSSPSLARFL